MPSYIDPSADGALNAWTKSSGTSAATLLDDGVRSPTNARTSGDGGSISESTDEDASDLVFPNTLTYGASQTITLYVYGSGGTKRAVDVEISYDDGTSWTASGGRQELIAAAAAAAWYSRVLTGITQQSHLDGLRVRLRCNSTAGGGGATAVQVDAVYVAQVFAASGTATASGGGSATAAARKGASATAALPGGGALTETGQKAGQGAALTAGGGSVGYAARKGGVSPASVSGGGLLQSVATKNAITAWLLQGGGSLAATGERYEGGGGDEPAPPATHVPISFALAGEDDAEALLLTLL